MARPDLMPSFVIDMEDAATPHESRRLVGCEQGRYACVIGALLVLSAIALTGLAIAEFAGAWGVLFH